MDKEFFIKHWYADIYEQQENQTDDVEYILSTIGDAPKRVLEIACGGGRILAPLAEAGHIVTGFDLDEYMLEKCRTRIKGLTNAACYLSDAVTQDWGENYEVVVMGGNLLVNIISDMDYEQSQRLFIKKAASCLAADGRFFLEFICDAGFSTNHDPNEYVIFEGKDDLGTYGQFVLFDQHDDRETRISKSKRRIKIVTKDGAEAVKEWDVTKHFPSFVQVKDWLIGAGFKIESTCGTFDGSPITDKTDRAIIWAKKV